MKRVDRASALLAKHCAAGSNFEKATLFLREPADDPIEYLKIEMNGVIIAHLSFDGAGDLDRPQETLGLNFAEFIMTYVPGDDVGGPSEEVIGGWNIATSTEAG